MIERKLVIGLITNTEFIKAIRPIWNGKLLLSNTARIVAQWCIEHYDAYGNAPKENIESIFFNKSRTIDTELAEEIEEDILPGLSDEYVKEGADPAPLIKQTRDYLTEQNLKLLSKRITDVLDNGDGDHESRIKEAERIRKEFKDLPTAESSGIELGSTEALKELKRAFEELGEPVIRLPKQLGEFMNERLVPGGFISFMAPEKRGKTFWLLALAVLAFRQGKRVAFFQAGDMSNAEQLKRLAILLAKRSDKEKYCQAHYEAVRDCVRNQKGECSKWENENDYGGIFDGWEDYEIKEQSVEDIRAAYEDNPGYKPCCDCDEFDKFKLGTFWVKKNPETSPLTYQQAKKIYRRFLKKNKSRFKMDSHANGTLSPYKINQTLDQWEDEDGFVPEVILIDYMDILITDYKGDERGRENQKWKEVRKISQTPRQSVLPLVIAPTQTDADSYKQYRLGLGNFSEDKRKYAHVTGMYGMNQDPEGKEKKMGIMRFNEILFREGEYSVDNEVKVIQNLRQGRPIKGSYF